MSERKVSVIMPTLLSAEPKNDEKGQDVVDAKSKPMCDVELNPVTFIHFMDATSSLKAF